MTARGKAKDEAGAAPADDGQLLVVDEAGAAEARHESFETALHRRRVQYGEYGQWVAAYDIKDDGGALMYAAGHPVPVDAVDEQTRAVVMARHRCHHTPDVRCELFNTPEVWTEPDAVTRPANFEQE